eukprot:276671-Amphidinium_carterae.2
MEAGSNETGCHPAALLNIEGEVRFECAAELVWPQPPSPELHYVSHMSSFPDSLEVRLLVPSWVEMS